VLRIKEESEEEFREALGLSMFFSKLVPLQILIFHVLA